MGNIKQWFWIELFIFYVNIFVLMWAYLIFNKFLVLLGFYRKENDELQRSFFLGIEKSNVNHEEVLKGGQYDHNHILVDEKDDAEMSKIEKCLEEVIKTSQVNKNSKSATNLKTKKYVAMIEDLEEEIKEMSEQLEASKKQKEPEVPEEINSSAQGLTKNASESQL